MNPVSRPRVRASNQTRWGGAALLLALALAGCVDVDGGAVEVGWDLRFPDGRRTDDDDNYIDCTKAQLGKMALALPPVGPGTDPCAGDDRCRFPCSHMGFGTTPFVIPEGEYSISLQILDPTGSPLGSGEGIVTPGPIVRQVRTGQITSLSVNLIIVDR
jgi:hypothetical protein